MKTVLVLLAVLFLAVSPAWAADVYWKGVSTQSATDLSQTDVDNSNLWDDAGTDRSPTTADRAVFWFNATTGTFRQQVVISSGSTFAPGSLTLQAPNWSESSYGPPLYVLKNMAVDTLKIEYGANSGGEGDNVLRIGATGDEAKAWLALAKNNWEMVVGQTVITGNAGSASIDFTGATGNITEIRSRVNAQSATTGVTLGSAGYWLDNLRSLSPGAAQFIRVQPQPGGSPAVFDAVPLGAYGASATTRAKSVLGAAGVPPANGTVTFEGNRGTAAVVFTAGEGADAIVAKINAVSASTGVVATKTGSDPNWTVTMESELVGTDKFVRIAPAGVAYFPTTRQWSYYMAGPAMTEAYGLPETAVTLDLQGTRPLDLTAGATTKCRSIRFGGAGSILRFSNSSVTLQALSQQPFAATFWGEMAGSGGNVEFSAQNGTVTLENPGIRREGNLHVGVNRLKVRSDQTWNNPSGNGFLSCTAAANAEVITSLNGPALDNLENIPLCVYAGNYSANVPSTTPARIPPGTYRGILFETSTAWGYTNYFKLTGDVSLAGGAIVPGNNDKNTPVEAATDPDYSLILHSQYVNGLVLNLGGYHLATDRGVKVEQTYNSTTYYSMIDARKDAANPGTTRLSIGGSLVLDAVARPGTANELRRIGIAGDDATVIDLAGDFKTYVRSLDPALYGLCLSTVNLVGGTGADPNTFEVGADRDDDFALGTWCINAVNVGDGTAAGVIKLLNQNLNDEASKAKAGEVLLARMLRVNAASTLDCNLATGSNPDGAGGVKLGGKALSTLTPVSTVSGTVNIAGNRGTADVATHTTPSTMVARINAASAQTGVTARLGWPGSTTHIAIESEFEGAGQFLRITKIGAAVFDATPLEAYGTDGLNVAPTGTLNLHTGGPLNAGDKVLAFCGMGDRTAAWNTFKDRVVDTDNPLLGFDAVTTTMAFEVGGAPTDMTVTVWQARSGGVLEITGASISPDWAFQNTASTVVNKHYGLLTVTVNDTWGNNSYTVTVTKTAGPGEVTVAATANDLEKRLYGSLRTDGITGTGTCQFSVQVVGDVGGDVTAAVSTTFKVRRLGDINNDNAVTTDDSVWLTKKLNNLDVTPLVPRDFDVTGDGFVTTDDDVLLTKILNNLAIP